MKNGKLRLENLVTNFNVLTRIATTSTLTTTPYTENDIIFNAQGFAYDETGHYFALLVIPNTVNGETYPTIQIYAITNSFTITQYILLKTVDITGSTIPSSLDWIQNQIYVGFYGNQIRQYTINLSNNVVDTLSLELAYDVRCIKINAEGTKLITGSMDGKLREHSLTIPYIITSLELDGTIDLNMIIPASDRNESLSLTCIDIDENCNHMTFACEVNSKLYYTRIN
tara:strand:+ start:520 stop:1200 length:681 start_codon:yes stop_codon:yes gene_type:complete